VREQDDNPVANQQDEPPPVRAPKKPTFSVAIENVSSEITAENVIQCPRTSNQKGLERGRLPRQAADRRDQTLRATYPNARRLTPQRPPSCSAPNASGLATTSPIAKIAKFAPIAQMSTPPTSAQPKTTRVRPARASTPLGVAPNTRSSRSPKTPPSSPSK
jgi:hypothetical protein